MKRVYIACLLVLLLTQIASAQSARVTVTIIKAPAFSSKIYLYTPSARFDPVSKDFTYIPLNANHSGSCMLAIKEPQSVLLDARGEGISQVFSYNLFLTPGDDLTIKIDPNKKDYNITVTGKGSNNNQPEIFALTDIFSSYELANDKTPYRAMATIKKKQKLNNDLLNNYIAKYKPGNDFIEASKYNVAYYPLVTYLFLKTKNLDDAHNHGSWQKVQDSLFATVNNSDGTLKSIKDVPVTAKLKNNSGPALLNNREIIAVKVNNDHALTAYNYTYLVSFFAERENERLLIEESDNPKAFYKEQYHTTVANGKKLFTDEQRSLLRETIINKYFSGKTAEYLYAVWLKENLGRSNYKNITVIFDHFKAKYPNSKYIAGFSGPINAIVKQQSATLNDKMIFVANNGTKLNTLKDVLAITKGKTVFVDMWGTWCSPCRQEIEKDSGPLRAYFKGKGVDFLYIANHDIAHEKEWKKLIAYYRMEGMHILANDKLDKDIMNKLKSSGYPTYFIIKKDGTFKKSIAQYPIDIQAITKELELASR